MIPYGTCSKWRKKMLAFLNSIHEGRLDITCPRDQLSSLFLFPSCDQLEREPNYLFLLQSPPPPSSFCFAFFNSQKTINPFVLYSLLPLLSTKNAALRCVQDVKLMSWGFVHGRVGGNVLGSLLAWGRQPCRRAGQAGASRRQAVWASREGDNQQLLGRPLGLLLGHNMSWGMGPR